MTIKKAKAPVRVDFAGGTTDIKPFTYTHGGAVLNCGIQRYVTGKLVKTDKDTSLSYIGNTPTSSGLGTSGAMNLIWLALISQIKPTKKIPTKTKLKFAEDVYKIEQAMGLVGGKQDQYASAFGGINFIEFKRDNVKLEQLKLSKNFIKKLENKLVLVYTGKPHFSGNTNKLMIENLKRDKNTKNLLAIKNIAIQMKNALKRQDIYKFANLMNEETNERKKLHKDIVGKQSQDIIKKGMENDAISAKVCGSGGGGSILFFTDNKTKLKKAFKNKVIDFKFDFEGLRYL
jgi:D-glycero-alpha-D-manno-heptose-7-phosphate kinase|tara:strand:- start:185 stop:1048 length:864 start_codon:yes stop_codon:yes gene_type:complete